MPNFATINSDDGVLILKEPEGTGDISITTIGSSPNSSGMTFSDGTLNLEPADEDYGGIITTSAQTLAGLKTFNDGIDLAIGQTYNINGSPHTHDYEASLGNPDADGKILSSTAAGVRSWIANVASAITLPSAALVGSPVAGKIEYDGSDFYFTV